MTERTDGRKVDQLRSISIELDYVNTSLGAVLLSMGQTKVLCTVSCEDRVPPFLVGAGKGWLTAEYAMLPRSSPRRVSREGATGKVNSGSREIQRLIGRSLRAAVDLEKLGERTLYIDCDVIQADGGTRTASITGAYVALRLAVDRLIAEGYLEDNPLTRPVAAVSVRSMVTASSARDGTPRIRPGIRPRIRAQDPALATSPRRAPAASLSRRP